MEQRGSSSGGEVWKGLARERKEKEKARKKEKGGREREIERSVIRTRWCIRDSSQLVHRYSIRTFIKHRNRE